MMIHNENKAGKRNGDGRNTENFEKARRRRPFKNAARYGWAHFQFALSPYLPHQRRTKTLPVAHVPKEFSMSIIYETFYVHILVKRLFLGLLCKRTKLFQTLGFTRGGGIFSVLGLKSRLPRNSIFRCQFHESSYTYIPGEEIRPKYNRDSGKNLRAFETFDP